MVIAEEWVPVQATLPEAVDLRGIATGPKGYKERNENLKRSIQDRDDDFTAMDEDAAAEDGQSIKRRKADFVKYIPIHQRNPKAPSERAGKVMRSSSKSSWERKMKEKAEKGHFLEHKKEALAEAKSKRKAIAEQRKAAKERKEANKEKSMVVQKITKNSTLKKMMKNKKQKKLLRKADTN
ncbi:hypothetical protein CEUSTIGMA_g12343.t1 [Chlamydomonas eustigma]|uniref:Coiled-coil domain-containing protein 86 n=1 Tax=Chlamydomonas eustigma TaxID=1157962 RepID=A0A250XPR9_9CHLO|nr:hypothetical protein CEUSTIGMA_g12343.t1 [Chlamydomonas eustigma]|eukprot:GAX84922.1 hypothetical protein CEUSTIGMA_g12343.t1 [Chlamydomonas eustigma]